ncbi:MAG: hypothetical protein QQN65_06480 [Nitrosopumilus sp.]
MSQTILFQEVSLPKKRSRNFNDKPLFQKKELTDKQKSWLKSHEETNWKLIELFQQYQTPKKKIKFLKWKLTGTQEKRETCGIQEVVIMFGVIPKTKSLLDVLSVLVFVLVVNTVGLKNG